LLRFAEVNPSFIRFLLGRGRWVSLWGEKVDWMDELVWEEGRWVFLFGGMDIAC